MRLALLVLLALALAGCAAPAASVDPVPSALAPLPGPIHDERAITVGVGPYAVTGCAATRPCVDYPFTLERPALLTANASWIGDTNAVSLEVLAGNASVGAAFPLVGERSVAIERNLKPGDHVLRVHVYRMANDRYTLDVSFSEATAPVLSTDWVERALPNGDGHDHFDPAQHVGLSTPNFEVVGWDPLVTDHMGSQAGGYFCGDLETREGRTLAVVHSFTSDVAFVLVDVTDPARPTKVGELVMERTHVWDVAMTPDQRHVVLATSPFGDTDSLPQLRATPAASYRDACSGELRAIAGPEAALPYEGGVVLVSIEDPRAPRALDHLPLPGYGAHSIVAQEVDGGTLILVTAENLGPLVNYHLFMGIVETPIGARLETYSVYETDVREQLAKPVYINHDGYLQVHPVTGKPVAYLADGTLGVSLLDISDPRMPRLVGRWDNATLIANPDYTDHIAHSVLPIEGTWDGRHYTFVSEECQGRPPETPSCLLYVLDTTDPSDPTLVGAWTLPVELGSWTYPGFSPHYMALVDRTLYVAHWHAGLWAFDVSTPAALRSPVPMGVFLPEADAGYDPDGGYYDQFNQAPVIADVLAHGENVVVFDGTSGVYVLRFDATRPAPSPVPWPLDLPDPEGRT